VDRHRCRPPPLPHHPRPYSSSSAVASGDLREDEGPPWRSCGIKQRLAPPKLQPSSPLPTKPNLAHRGGPPRGETDGWRSSYRMVHERATRMSLCRACVAKLLGCFLGENQNLGQVCIDTDAAGRHARPPMFIAGPLGSDTSVGHNSNIS
jgi:hypothetical protein